MRLTQGLRVLSGTLQARLLGRRTPLSVYISITDRCPFHCAYCNIPSRKLPEMSFRQICRIIDEAASAGMWRLQIVGGEPMMRDDAPDIAAHAKDRGCFVTLSSNGHRVAERAEELKSADVVFLSFDGPEEVHDAQKGKGSFKNLMRAMDALKENNVKFWTTTVLTAANTGCIDFIMDTARDKGFQTVFQPVYYTGAECSGHIHKPEVAERLRLDQKDFRSSLNKLIALKKEHAPVASSLAYLEYLLDWEDCARPYSKKQKGDVRCFAGKLYCYIDTNGLMFPCGDSAGRTEAPDVTKTGFTQAFNSLPPAPCSSCIIACDLEKNLMFSFSPSAIWNWLRLV